MTRLSVCVVLRFVDQVLTVISDLTRQIASEISELSSLVRQNTLDQEEIRNRRSSTLLILLSNLRLGDKHAQILEWLSPVNPGETREKVSKSRIVGSGKWFTASEQLQEWRQSKTSSTFWLNGISTTHLGIMSDRVQG